MRWAVLATVVCGPLLTATGWPAGRSEQLGCGPNFWLCKVTRSQNPWQLFGQYSYRGWWEDVQTIIPFSIQKMVQLSKTTFSEMGKPSFRLSPRISVQIESHISILSSSALTPHKLRICAWQKISSEILQNLLYIWHKKTDVFHFVLLNLFH